MFLAVKRGAARVIAGRPTRVIPGRPIIGEPCMAADATGTVMPATATQIKMNMRFVFISDFTFLLIAHGSAR